MAATRENPNFLSVYTTPAQSVDLYKYPLLRLKPRADEEFTLGDLHANAMYFLHVLIYIGVVDFDDTDEAKKQDKYKRLLEIYLKHIEPIYFHNRAKYGRLFGQYVELRIDVDMQLKKEDLTNFANIISTLKVTNPVALIRLLGDEFADGGQGDEFIQAIITQLDILNIPNESLISNHGVERLEAFEKPQEKFYPPRLKAKVGTIPLGVAQQLVTQRILPVIDHKLVIKASKKTGSIDLVRINFDTAQQLIDQGHLDKHFFNVDEKARSMIATQQLIERKILTYEDIKAAHDNHYKLKLKVLSYTLSADKKDITLYTHAGVGLKTIRAIAEKLKIKYQAHTAIALAATIDAINEKFQEHVKNNTVHTLYDPDVMRMAYHGAAQFCKQTDKITPPSNEQLIEKGIPKKTIENCNITNNPFEFLMWCRRYDIDDRPAIKTASSYFGQVQLTLNGGGFNIYFVHGHDSEDSQAVNINLPTLKSHIYNLNNMIGRTIKHNEGDLFILSARNHDKTQVLKLAEDFKELDVNENNQLSKQTMPAIEEDEEFTLIDNTAPRTTNSKN